MIRARRHRHRCINKSIATDTGGGPTSTSGDSTASSTVDDPPSLGQENEGDDHQSTILTSALLKISFDGAHFSGWSAANRDTPDDDDDMIEDEQESSTYINNSSSLPFRPSRRRRRRAATAGGGLKKGHVRSVQGVIQTNLAKLFGNVDPSRSIIVEGCSRTDKGVHAQGMVAQFYCLANDHDAHAGKDDTASVAAANNGTTSIVQASSSSGARDKKLPHPLSSWDPSPSFVPIPMNLTKLMYVLNRMLPHDVKIVGVATVPELAAATTNSNATTPRNNATIRGSSASVFRPSQMAISKTYQYKFSVGQVHDPTQWRHTWHLQHYDASRRINVQEMRRVCQELLLGKHDFCAFRGAPRGNEDKRRHARESTQCTLTRVDVDECIDDTTFPGTTLATYTVTIAGDRFLYKMMRFVVGALVAVGTSRLSYRDIQLALETGSWEENGGRGRKQFTCAPPHGLNLKHVLYNESIDWTTT